MPPAIGQLWEVKMEPRERQRRELEEVEKLLGESRSEFYKLDGKERGDRVTRTLHEVMITSPGSGPTVVWRALLLQSIIEETRRGSMGGRLKCSRLYASGSNGSRTVVEGQEMCEQLAASHERKWREEADQWRAVETRHTTLGNHRPR